MSLTIDIIPDRMGRYCRPLGVRHHRVRLTPCPNKPAPKKKAGPSIADEDFPTLSKRKMLGLMISDPLTKSFRSRVAPRGHAETNEEPKEPRTATPATFHDTVEPFTGIFPSSFRPCSMCLSVWFQLCPLASLGGRLRTGSTRRASQRATRQVI
ncbi:hypothetical protein BS47DRAFT_1135962 [Hydnum rufescens UP504]|uniref:Uncharacterized protein n=1 Tax=Hydnum rufescens UP504 TaxID=1448309 RepID=A0A9P6AA60_9AGAM|nr:hypothetical protein BS47DRAFT_1135962 [Hydnum rufescens UP504]